MESIGEEDQEHSDRLPEAYLILQCTNEMDVSNSPRAQDGTASNSTQCHAIWVRHSYRRSRSWGEVMKANVNDAQTDEGNTCGNVLRVPSQL